jgi:hypothetical protein
MFSIVNLTVLDNLSGKELQKSKMQKMPIAFYSLNKSSISTSF